MTAYTIEPVEDSRLFLTVFCIGTPGIEVAECLYGVGLRDTNLVIAHTDRAQLMGSYVKTNWPGRL